MKRLIQTILAAFLICVGGLLCRAAAASGYERIPIEIGFPRMDCDTSDACAAVLNEDTTIDMDGAEQKIYLGFLNLEERIDISEFAFPVDTERGCPELSECLSRVRTFHPDLFYLGTIYYFPTYDSQTGKSYVSAVQAEYGYGEELETAKADYEARLNEIAGECPENATDLEKVLYVHEYAVSHFEYDYRIESQDQEIIAQTVYDAYRMMKEETGVCQAYTLFCQAMFQKLNIQGGFAMNYAARHIWNLVKLDDVWYHMDATWDDADDNARASHKYFLKSSGKLASDWFDSTHGSWVGERGQEAASTLYDEMFWDETDSIVLPLNGSWYYAAYGDDNETGGLYRRSSLTEDTKEKVFSLDRWKAGENSYYVKYFTGLVEWDSGIVFNSSRCIYYVNTDGRIKTLLETEEEEAPIFCIDRKNGTIRYWQHEDYHFRRSCLAPKTLEPVLSCGFDLNWTLENGVLTISGSGSMRDFKAGKAPWYDRAAEIESIRISEGVTSIGTYAFEDCVKLSWTELPESLLSVHSQAYPGCPTLLLLCRGNTEFAEGAAEASAEIFTIRQKDGCSRWDGTTAAALQEGKALIYCRGQWNQLWLAVYTGSGRMQELIPWNQQTIKTVELPKNGYLRAFALTEAYLPAAA